MPYNNCIQVTLFVSGQDRIAISLLFVFHYIAILFHSRKSLILQTQSKNVPESLGIIIQSPWPFRERQQVFGVCPLTPVYDISLQVPRRVRSSIWKSPWWVFWTRCQICGILKAVGRWRRGSASESKLTKTAANRKDKFSNMIILSGQLTRNKCSLAPCGNDNFKKQTGELQTII